VRKADLPADAVLLLEYPWQIVHANEAEITRQVGAMQRQRLGRVYPGAHLLNESAIHIGAGSRIKPAAVLDAEAGPIFVGENATVSPNVTITGPAYIGDGCTIQPGASIRGGTSIGPVCKVGGEVEGTIIHAYSNKQHDGFVGHSYVGEWVNLGADTVNSDLKNTYGSVRVTLNGLEIDTGLKFVGAFIGDHAKTGIGTRLPTGCIVGYAANIFTSRYAPKSSPSFAWLTDEGLQFNDPQKALAVARKVVARRNRKLSQLEEALFLSIAETARQFESRS
jgi:UDP-N-acetylglucosamine diphosphorylase/glucosamine-1-phosphate N-acetyltransferase